MIYTYQSDDGELETHEQRLTHPVPPPETIERGGKVYKRVWGAAGGASPKGWPMECVASGVNAADAQKLRDEFKRLGVPTEVTNDGDPIYTSPEHRRRALKARGFFDRSSYY